MYVIMDIEWYETKKHHICPTQIAALRVDDEWNTVSVFSELICPHMGEKVPWEHVAFSGSPPDAFAYAFSAYAIFDRLEKWLKPDDVLCWWNDEPADALRLLLKAILKHDYSNRTCILKPYFNACVRDGKSLKGNPYALSRKRGIAVPEPEHCSLNDVSVLQKLLHRVKFPAYLLDNPVPDKIRKVKTDTAELLFLYDPATKLLHLPDSECIKDKEGLVLAGSIKRCIAKGYRPCPACCRDTWKKELRKYNEENIAKRACSYYFFDNSKVFHKASCHVILNAVRYVSAAIYYDTCVKSGRVPCRICRPEAEQYTDGQKQNINVSSKYEPGNENKRGHTDDSGQWLKKKERQALARYTQASTERKAAAKDTMSAEKRKDMLTLTTTNFAFWAAHGYGNFHMRNCRKLNGLTNLKGFETFQQAVRAGYSPCRECRPSKNDNMDISMPIYTKQRKNESLEEILALCTHIGVDYNYSEPILHIKTPSSEWKINIMRHPVIVDHKPSGSNVFHQQHRMFMSVIDTVWYIARHDSVKKQSLEAMLIAIRHKK